MATASKGDDDSIFKTPALPPPRKAAFSNSLLKPHFAINPVGSPLSLGISAPNTPQSELSDCSYLQLQGVPENSSYFCAASAVDVNVTYQVSSVSRNVPEHVHAVKDFGSIFFEPM